MTNENPSKYWVLNENNERVLDKRKLRLDSIWYGVKQSLWAIPGFAFIIPSVPIATLGVVTFCMGPGPPLSDHLKSLVDFLLPTDFTEPGTWIPYLIYGAVGFIGGTITSYALGREYYDEQKKLHENEHNLDSPISQIKEGTLEHRLEG